MAKMDETGHKSAPKEVRELIRSEDNRRHIHKLLKLVVEPELPPALASLLAAIDRAKEETMPTISKRRRVTTG
jgi:hypothetical protein